MKKNLLKLLTFALISSFVLVSCNKDEDDPTPQSLAGTYDVTDIVTGFEAGTYNYTVTVTASATEQNRILIQDFGGFEPVITVYAEIIDGRLSVPSQNPSGFGAGNSISGSGTVEGSDKIAKISYIAQIGTNASNGNATYTKK